MSSETDERRTFRVQWVERWEDEVEASSVEEAERAYRNGQLVGYRQGDELTDVREVPNA